MVPAPDYIILLGLLISVSTLVYLYLHYKKTLSYHLSKQSKDEETKFFLNAQYYQLAIIDHLKEYSSKYKDYLSDVLPIIFNYLSDFISFTLVSVYYIEPKNTLVYTNYINSTLGSEYIRAHKTESLHFLAKKENIKDLHKYSLKESSFGGVLNKSSEKMPKNFVHLSIPIKKRKNLYITFSFHNDFSLGSYNDLVTFLKSLINDSYNTYNSYKNKVCLSTKDSFNAYDGYVFINSTGEIIFANKNAYSYLEVPYSKYPPKKRKKLLWEKLNKLNLIEESLEVIKNHKPQELGNIKIGHKYLRNTLNSVDGFCLITLENITKRKKIESLREDYMHMLVHDLRAPLTVMRGTADILAKREKDLSPLKKKELLSEIKDRSEKMLDTVNDILDIAKMKRGKFEIVLTEQDFVSFVKNRIEFFRPLLEKRGIKYSFKLPKKALVFPFDKELIARAIDNLISNASKYTKKGSIFVEVSVLKNGFVKFSVRDTGIGISSSSQKKLFKMFEQGDVIPTKTSVGTGLGLVITKRIVEQHNGQIGFKSKLGKGSEFYFVLPLYKNNANK